MYRNHKNKNKTMKRTNKRTNKNKTTKCYSFCKNDYVKHANHRFSEFKNKQKKLLFNDCKHIYCSNDCVKQYIKNLKIDEKGKNTYFLEDYKKRLDNNNFLTNIDKRYKNPKKFKQVLLEKGAFSSCVSQNKDYYNPLHK